MKRDEEADSKRIPGKRTAIGCGVLFVLLAVVLTWALVEPFVLTVTRITIRKKDIPEAFDGFRIAHLSDIHHGPYVSLRFVRRVVEMTNRLDPDLVLISGDFIAWDKKYAVPCLDALKYLKSRQGVLTVFGNRDEKMYEKDVRRHLELSGIEFISHRSKWIYSGDARFKVGGVRILSQFPKSIESTLADVDRDDFVVVLVHNPDIAKDVPEDLVDLVLAGHTHGGQITLFGLYAPFLSIKSGQEYRSGVVQKGPMTIIVSRGIGTILLPFRFFSPPEIILITLEHEEG